jgi:transglutaminase-like putative cysteine protease
MEQLEIELEDSQLPFLYPNQYVNFNKDSKAVKKAAELDVNMETTLDTIQAIYNYVITNVEYDYEKAENVQSGYLPVVDDTLETGKGICFDYAALMTAMLRSRGIPSKLVIGYTSDIYHSWISVYTKEQGWIDNVIEFNGKQWRMMDPTFAAGNNDEETLKYISDENNYIAKYVH